MSDDKTQLMPISLFSLKSEEYFDDSSNSYQYILFVLVIYAISFLSLMIKYFFRSGDEDKTRMDNLYDEFVKRDSFKAKRNELLGKP